MKIRSMSLFLIACLFSGLGINPATAADITINCGTSGTYNVTADAPDLLYAGLVKSDSSYKKSIFSALRRAALSRVSTFEGIKSYIADVEKVLDVRKAALLAACGPSKAILERWASR